MPRRGQISKRDVLPDPLYNSKLVTKLINNVMLDGKKGVAQKIVYDAFATVEAKTGKPALEAFQQALDNIMPVLEVKARRLGGSTYQVPMEVRPERRQTLGRKKTDARTSLARSLCEKTRREDDVGKTFCRNHRCARKYRRRGEEERRNAQDGRSQQSFRAFQILIFQYRSHLVIPCI